MYRTKDRGRAIELRLRGMSYSQIKRIIPAGKGTLNYWLKNYQLTDEQKKKLYGRRDLWIEKFREVMKAKREEKLKKIYTMQKSYVGRINKRDLAMMGTGLYWGEGQKGGSSVSVSNTDPEVMKFCLLWLEKCFGVNRKSEKMRIYTHFYSDMDVEKETDFWRRTLGVNKPQFAKPYIKLSKRSDLDYKSFGHGTCRIQLSNVKIKERVMANIQIFSELADLAVE